MSFSLATFSWTQQEKVTLGRGRSTPDTNNRRRRRTQYILYCAPRLDPIAEGRSRVWEITSRSAENCSCIFGTPAILADRNDSERSNALGNDDVATGELGKGKLKNSA